MKQLTITIFTLLVLSTNTLADTIKVGNIENIYVADSFVGSSNIAEFEQSFSPGRPLAEAAFKTIVTSDYRTSVKNPVNSSAYIDLAFSNKMYGGAGDDLVLFFVGNSTSFGLDVFEKQNTGNTGAINTISTGTYTISTSDTVYNNDNTWKCFNGIGDQCTGGFALSAIYIDFGQSFDNVEIGNIRLTLGQGFNGVNSSNFALAGGFHDAVVVPLPLPIVLFSSGLVLLGWMARRKAA